MDEAQTQLQLLTGEPDPVISWQTFDDSKAKRRDLAHSFHARLSDCEPQLHEMQKGGSGIFISVNATDGRGRKKENIVSYRAVFLDFDGQPLPASWPIAPGLIVNSSTGKFQCWWRLKPGLDLAGWQALHHDLIARYGADPKCATITQVGRLAGFLHQKAEPFRVKIISGPRDERHSLEDFAAAFGVDLEDAMRRHAERLKPASGEAKEPPCGWDHEVDIERATAWLKIADNWYTANSGGISVFKTACMMRDFGLSPGKAEELMEDHIPAMPDAADGDAYYVRRKIEGAFKRAKNEPGCRSIAADIEALNRLLDE